MSAHNTPEYLLAPDNIIEFGDITELVTFEDFVAQEVDPYFNQVVWSGRIALRDLIKPPKFNGNIADIQLKVMANPYERLIDAPSRGWHARGNAIGEITRLSSDLAGEMIPRYKGFILTANAKSSGRGTIGQIQAEMWYYPMPLFRKTIKAGTQRRGTYKLAKTDEAHEYTYTMRSDSTTIQKGNQKGETIRRVVTKPRLERDRFDQLDETSRRIGVDLLRDALAHTILTPIQD